MKRVYFIKPVGMDGPIKIGCSAEPPTRLAAFAAWSPIPLEIVAEIDGGKELEERFHAAFIDHHSHLEWFHAHPEVLTAIGGIRAGAFDLDTLPYASGPIAGMKKRHKSWKPIDYEYYGLWAAYRARDHKAVGWIRNPVAASVFAAMPAPRKREVFGQLHSFIRRARELSATPTEQGQQA